jgi:hypothetical protein
MAMDQNHSTGLWAGLWARLPGSGAAASQANDGSEMSLIEPLMPSRKTTERPRKTHSRDVRDALPRMAAAGCRWTMIPKAFPPPFDGAALFP